MNTAVTELIRVHVDIIILNSLFEQDRYGLDILSTISQASCSKYEIKQPTLYNILKRLEKHGLINSYEGDESLGAKRRYYSLSEDGKEYVKAYKNEWVYTRTLLDNLVSNEKINLAEIEPPFDASSLRPLTRRDSKQNEEEENEESIILDVKAEEKNDIVISKPFFEYIQAEPKKQTAPPVEGVENRDRASRLLGIGKYAPKPGYSITSATLKNPNAGKKKSIYNKIFTESMERYHEKPKMVNLKPKAMQFNDLKVTYKNQGIAIESYNPIERLTFYKRNFIKINRIKLNASLLTFLVLFFEIVALYVFKQHFNIPQIVYPIIIALCFPYYQIIKFSINPKARQLLNYNFYISLLTTIVIFVFCITISSIIFIINPSLNIDFRNIKFYIPWLVFSNFIVYQLIYHLLFKSKRYHCKSAV